MYLTRENRELFTGYLSVAESQVKDVLLHFLPVMALEKLLPVTTEGLCKNSDELKAPKHLPKTS